MSKEMDLDLIKQYTQVRVISPFSIVIVVSRIL